ncbi:hypothetical protein ABH924_001106 [Arthrobacter sp. GAS37]
MPGTAARREVLADRADPVTDPPAVVSGFPFPDPVVELIQTFSDRHWGETVAAEPAHFAFHAALLVGSGDAGQAVEGIEAVVRAEQQPPVVLLALPTLPEDHGGDGTGEVVTADVPDRHATDLVERLDVALQKRLLGLRPTGRWTALPE